MAKRKSASSLFNWEDAFYGGFKRIVWDHPKVFIPEGITYTYDKIQESRYFSDLLCEIFLAKVVSSNVYHTLMKNHSVGEYEANLILTTNKESVRNCITFLKRDERLGNLFEHYEEFYNGVTFQVSVSNRSCKDDDGGGCSNESIMRSVSRKLSEVKEIKSLWELFSSKSTVTDEDLKKSTTFVDFPKSGNRKWEPTSGQITTAASIVRLLDISFDPQSDKIENLRCGKMSGHKIAEVPAGNSHIYHRVEEDVITKPFSIVILCDESGSMGSVREQFTEAWSQNNLVKCLYLAFEQILPSNKIYIFGHSGCNSPEIRTYNDRQINFYDTILNQEDVSFQQNYDGPVIECIYEKVRKETSDNIIFISISDGEPSGHSYGGKSALDGLKRIIEKCKRDGFVTMGVGVSGYDGVKQIYSYSTVATNNKEIIKNVPRLINTLVKNEFK